MLTFHQIVRDCAEGKREGWRALAAEYTPLFTNLLSIYLAAEGSAAAATAWSSTLRDLAADGAARLRDLSHHSEREFLVDLRRLVLDHGWPTTPDENDSQQGRSPAAQARAVLEGLPLLHQQVVFLKLSGYGEEAIEKLLRITPGVARQGLERLRSGDGFSRADWLRALKQAWSGRTESCPGTRTLIRIQDGQVTWYDREPVERHIVTCSHCLELWTALAEIRYWRREAHALSAIEAERLLFSMLPAAASSKGAVQKPGILKAGKG